MLFEEIRIAFVRFGREKFKGDDRLPGRLFRRVNVADELHFGRRIVGGHDLNVRDEFQFKSGGGLPQFKTTSVFGGIKIRGRVVECGGKRSATPLSSPYG